MALVYDDAPQPKKGLVYDDTSAVPAPPKDDLPWDVPMTGAQMRAAQSQAAKADETLKAAEPEPGFLRMLVAPFLGAAKAGQAMLGERPPLTPTEMLGSAAAGADPFGGGVGTSAVMARDLGAAADWARARGTPHPWTPEMVTRAAEDLGAPTRARAQKIVERRINQVSPTTAQSAIDTINAAREAGDPMMLPDVLRPAEALAGRVARAPGVYGDILPEAFQARNAGAVQRLTGGINQAFGEEGAYDAAQALMSARKTAAKPAYDTAYAHPPINPDVMKPEGAIGALMERPSVRAGMANARKIAAEEGVDMNTLGIDLDAQGEPILTRVPTWQTLDYVKRGIDNVVEQYRDKTTGKLILDTYGRAADITRSEFVRTLRDLNPKYAAALDTWGGPSRSLDAIEVGKDALTRSPEVNAARLRDMTDDEKEFARLGIAQTLRDVANRRGPLAAEFDRISGTRYGSTSTREQLRPFFRSDADYQKFVDSVQRQVTMARTPNKVLGGSQTAGRVAEDQSPITAGDAAHGALALGGGHVPSILRAGVNIGQKLWDRRDPTVNAEMARILSDINITLGRDPRTNRIVLQRSPPSPEAAGLWQHQTSSTGPIELSDRPMWFTRQGNDFYGLRGAAGESGEPITGSFVVSLDFRKPFVESQATPEVWRGVEARMREAGVPETRISEFMRDKDYEFGAHMEPWLVDALRKEGYDSVIADKSWKSPWAIALSPREQVRPAPLPGAPP